MSSHVSLITMLDGKPGVWCHGPSGELVWCESGEARPGVPWKVWFGFPWWWSRFLKSTMIATTACPQIGLRALPNTVMGLDTFFHERFGHGEDQMEFYQHYAKYRLAWCWYLRYFWRMLWCGFDYHDPNDAKSEVDERTARRIEARMMAWWVKSGRPRIVSLELAHVWMRAEPTA